MSEPSNVHLSLDWAPKHDSSAYDGETVTVTAKVTFTPGTRTVPNYDTDLVYSEWTDAFVSGAQYDRLTSAQLQSGSVTFEHTWHASTQQWSAPAGRNGLHVMARIWGVTATLDISVTHAPPAVIYGMLFIQAVDKGGYLVMGADVRVLRTVGAPGYDKTYNTGDTGEVWTEQIPQGYYRVTASKGGFTGSKDDYLQSAVPNFDYVRVQIPGYVVPGPNPKPPDPILPDPPPIVPIEGSLYGIVISVDGAPLKNAAISVKAIGGGASGGASARSDENGSFIMNLAPGIWELTCTATGYITQTQDQPVYDQRTSGATVVNFNMYTSKQRADLRFGQIAGFVKTQDGIPIAGANTTYGRTDEYGFFFSDRLNVGTYRIDVSHPNYKSTSVTVTVLDGQLTRVTILLEPAPPAPPKYTLTISYAGSGSGATNPAAGSYQYDVGTTLGVSASAAAGSSFDHWELDGTVRAENPINITNATPVIMNLVAVFTAAPPTQFKLDIRSIGPGTTDPTPGIHLYNSGEVVAVTAIPTPGMNAFFDHWELDGTKYTQNPLSVNMLADHLLTSFIGQTPKWTLSISVVGQGTTNPVPGDHQYDDNTALEVQALPLEGWLFDYWSLDNSPVATNPLPITMKSNVGLVANFKQSPAPIPVTIGLAIEPNKAKSMDTVKFSGSTTGIEAGGILAIEVLGTDEAWHQVTTTAVGSDGTFSAQWQVPWDSWGRKGCETWRLRATRNVTNSNEVGLSVLRDTRIRDLSAPEKSNVGEEITISGYLEQFEQQWIPLQGSVVVSLNEVDAGQVNTDPSGMFSFKYKVQTKGAYTIKARYAGDASVLGLLGETDTLLSIASAGLALAPVIFASVIVLVSELEKR